MQGSESPPERGERRYKTSFRLATSEDARKGETGEGRGERGRGQEGIVVLKLLCHVPFCGNCFVFSEMKENRKKEENIIPEH